jgi:arylsulfatase A-like enzyme
MIPRTHRHVWLTFLCAVGWVLPLGALAAGATARPNILYILADDMGVGDVSSLNPHCAWKTPALDRLAREGRTFTDAHSASGVCSPSRYTLLTGRYSWRGQLKSSVLHGYDAPLLETNRITVADYLRQHGYATAMVGKWHLGLDWAKTGSQVDAVDFSKRFGGGPVDHGFDSFLGISASLDMPPYVYLRDDRSTTVPTNRVADSPKPAMWRAGWVGSDFHHADVQPRFLERSLQWLHERKTAGDGKPFFLYLALASPHTPIVPTGGFRGKSGANAYGDFVLQVDDAVGQLLDALDRLGMASNTLVVFTADNGCSPAANLDELHQVGHDPSAGFRGHKADLFEGGHRVPFIARWPGQVPAGTRCSQTIGHLDLLATCAAILGKTLPDHVGEDSVSFLPLLRRGDDAGPSRESLVHQSNNGSFAIRMGRWKLLLTPDSGGWGDPKPDSPASKSLPRFQLYDLESDPAESRNVAAEHPEIVTRLGTRMRTLLDNGRTTPGAPQPYFNPQSWPQTAWRGEFRAAPSVR